MTINEISKLKNLDLKQIWQRLKKPILLCLNPSYIVLNFYMVKLTENYDIIFNILSLPSALSVIKFEWVTDINLVTLWCSI
jgi:hypothetical protein